MPAKAQATYRDLYPRELCLAKLFADSGVRMTGTDGGSMMAPGLTLRQEFAELAKGGLSPLTILQMTTMNPRSMPWSERARTTRRRNWQHSRSA
jgi:hypothetical protein